MVDKEIKFLKDWVLRYIKNKDIMTKKIVSVDEFDDGFHILKKNNEQKFFIIPFLKDVNEVVTRIKEYEYGRTVVCFHTKENYGFLIKNWGVFVDLGRNFTIYFVNPFSKTERVLSLSPYTHHLISDKDSLKQGLMTMSENVEFTTEEEVKKIINS